jgi:hypothetical protein
MQVRARSLLFGIATNVPGFPKEPGGTGGTGSALYCYSVWLRHLVRAHEAGLPVMPSTVAELGPGDSIGIGLASLLCGASRYFALDVVRYAPDARNLGILGELVELFRARTAIPGDDVFPNVFPKLDSYDFPAHLLPESVLEASLAPERVSAIATALRTGRPAGGIEVTYMVPWQDPEVIHEGAVDLVLSQAVMEHVDSLAATYDAVACWLAPGGFASHTIDFSSHSMTRSWNGHWTVGESTWSLLRGRRPWLLNRVPLSTHRDLTVASGLKVLSELRYPGEPLPRRELATRFADLTDEDLTTRCVYVVAIKPLA